MRQPQRRLVEASAAILQAAVVALSISFQASR